MASSAYLALTVLLIVSAVQSRINDEVLRNFHARYGDFLDASLTANSDERIAGGNPVSPKNKYPSAVYLFVTNNSGARFICGGSLIAPEYVLTNANCTFNVECGSIYAVAGESNVAYFNRSETVQIRSAVWHRIHPEVDLESARANLAVIKLNGSMTIDDEYVAVASLSRAEPGPSWSVTAVGWGAGSDANAYSPYLREVQMLVLSDQDARDNFDWAVEPHYNSLLFTSTDGGRAICLNDFGSPLYDSTGAVQVGIASHVPKEGCLSGKPSAFTSVAHYLDWICQQAEMDCNMCLVVKWQ